MSTRLLSDSVAKLRTQLTGLYALLGFANLSAWGWALAAFHHFPVLLGTALLAYSFGLRHAVDADHIAAIDNVTRKLMQEGKRPVAVGFFFSLGHSTIVVALSLAIAATAAALQHRFAAIRDVGGVVGTLASAFFLFAIAIANVVVLMAVYKAFRRVKAGGRLIEQDIDALLANRGLLARLFRRLFRLIGRSWQMYPLGLLFGLGFDTATEIGLLGVSAVQASQGLPIWSIMVFPALFTAGMSLIDTLDGTLMLAAYDWAFVKPMRKLYYNMTITFASVLIALVVGGVETLGLLAGRLGFEGPFWQAIVILNDNFGALGFVIVALFLVTWLVSVAVYRAKRYDELEVET